MAETTDVAATAQILRVSVDTGPVRFVRVVASAVDPLPDWHPGAGSPGWVFVDEIIVEE